MSDDAPFIPARDHATRSLAARCEACEAWTESTAPVESLTCSGCGKQRPVSFTTHVDEQGRLDGCPLCGYHTLAIQKDVNGKLGVIVVVVTFGALLFSGLSVPWLLAALVPLALVDWLLLRLVVKRLLICYRCKSQFRGFPPGPRCRPFDLATWEAHTPPAAP